MCKIRQTALQAELKRIEAQAEANSFAIMNQADALGAAVRLCQLINDVTPKSFDDFEPYVTYFGDGTCEVAISPHANADILFRRMIEIGLSWFDTGEAWAGAHDFSVVDFPGVHVYVKNQYLPTPAEVCA